MMLQHFNDITSMRAIASINFFEILVHQDFKLDPNQLRIQLPTSSCPASVLWVFWPPWVFAPHPPDCPTGVGSPWPGSRIDHCAGWQTRLSWRISWEPCDFHGRHGRHGRHGSHGSRIWDFWDFWDWKPFPLWEHWENWKHFLPVVGQLM